MTLVSPEPMGSELTISDRQTRFSPAQRTALGHMGVDRAPDADVDVFFHVCQRTRLDPFARQIYMIGRAESVLVDGQWTKQMKYTIQTGIDGYRTIARRTAAGQVQNVDIQIAGDNLRIMGKRVVQSDNHLWRRPFLRAKHRSGSLLPR